MTAESLYSGDWEVLDCFDGNPVPGDPEAIASLAVQLLTHSRQAQDHETKLSRVFSKNADSMAGDYAESFKSVLASLPRAANGLGSVYEACGRALDSFAETLGGIQEQAASYLGLAAQADADYREAASAVCDLAPGTTMTGINEPGAVWRGLTAAWAAEAAGAYAQEDPELPQMAAEYGAQAESAEADRQLVVGRFQGVLEEYQAAVGRCVSAIQAAVPDMPYPSQFVAKLT